MAALYDRVKVTASAAPGVGPFAIGAAVPGYRTLADAGVAASTVVSYVIEDGTSWEIGHGICTSDGHVNRSKVIASSNGGAAINASANAALFLTALAEDLSTVTFGSPAAYSGQSITLKNIASTSGFTGIAEATFKDANGNAIAPVSATSSANPFGAGTTGPQFAIDGDATTSCQIFSGPGNYITFNFGRTVTFGSYSIQNINSNAPTGYNPTGWDLFITDVTLGDQYINSVSGNPQTSGTVETFTVPLNPTPVPASTAGTAYTARYWRLSNVLPNGAGYASIAELTFYDANGAKLTPTAVTAGSAPFGGGEVAASVDDGNPATQWTGNSGSWIELDFGADVSPASYSVQNRADGNTTYNAASWQLLAGESDSSLVAVGSGTISNSDPNTAGKTGYYVIPRNTAGSSSSSSGGSGAVSTSGPITARYWRIAKMYSQTSYVGTGELQWFDKNGTQIVPQVVTSDGNNTDPLANATDGNLGTYWTSGSPGRAFLSCDFGTAVTPATFLLSARNGMETCNIIELQLEASLDGLYWTPLGQYTPTWTGADNETRTMTIYPNASGFAAGTGPA